MKELIEWLEKKIESRKELGMVSEEWAFQQCLVQVRKKEEKIRLITCPRCALYFSPDLPATQWEGGES